ncbi:5-formyltetrahydrofolate cyclo-ligase [Pajaroellobacter abortibovis]|uniref:5-formyltetrahydrofolate cyclo-ligase n=1 Tax=Pajaroellobacter abortibovis TaxID=1882918 RepID=A0A1L6MYH8_9BACT|nr:5-formyltetrahydrofolate cyclo-ligase [Pajaroellobacter abortibovis]
MDESERLLRVQAKNQLRRRMQNLRLLISDAACEARSACIRSFLMQFPPLLEARTIALFWPMEKKNEVDLRPLHLFLQERGKTMFYPFIDQEKGEMTFREANDISLLEQKGFLKEPSAASREVDRGELDVIIVPGLAMDLGGYRIGYGSGWYDRTLPRFIPPARTIGVVFDYQLIVEVPVAPHDQGLNWVVTDRKIISAEAEIASGG